MTNKRSRGRLIVGGTILIVGFLSPLLIPLVTSTNWSVGIKTTVSGLLAFGIPEVFMLIAISVMGKEGYNIIKSSFLKYLRKLAPSDQVSLTRHRIGIVLFSLPILYGWSLPYLGHYIDFLSQPGIWHFVIGDIIFLTSFFVLGGDFWDKFSGLFRYGGKINPVQ